MPEKLETDSSRTFGAKWRSDFDVCARGPCANLPREEENDAGAERRDEELLLDSAGACGADRVHRLDAGWPLAAREVRWFYATINCHGRLCGEFERYPIAAFNSWCN
jgi:hypothetical protein